MWIVLNSFKSAFQLDKQDLSLLPTDFVRVARATVNDADGKTIFIMADLPDWVLNWKDLDEGVSAAAWMSTGCCSSTAVMRSTCSARIWGRSMALPVSWLKTGTYPNGCRDTAPCLRRQSQLRRR